MAGPRAARLVSVGHDHPGGRLSTPPRSEVTAILHRLARDPGASPEDAERLLALVYDELRALADALMRRERPGHTLQPTILVHDAWLRLVDARGVDWQDRSHFFGIAARAMRQLLVDHARKRLAVRRGGGGWTRVSLSEAEAATADDVEVLALHEAMLRLTAVDPRAARVVELRVFGGLKVEEVAHLLGVSPRTVDGDWSMARLWLKRELAGPT